jgi:hypothetical protein
MENEVKLIGFEIIDKTREYLDYLEEHFNNVHKAFNEIAKKCKNMFFIKELEFYNQLIKMVIEHDISKFSDKEFTQYRDYFFPCSGCIQNKEAFDKAFENHVLLNNHHWQNWVNSKESIEFRQLCCVHMVIDWLAMSYKFNDTPRNYYENNTNKIKLPLWAVDFIYEIFDALENKNK